MRIAYCKTDRSRNHAESVTADSEDSDWPATNLLDDRPQRKFKADGTNEATLTVVVPAGANSCCFVGYTNAESITITVKNTAESTTYSTATYDLTPSSPARTFDRCWHEWTNEGVGLHVIVELEAASGAVLEVGEVVVCDMVALNEPKVGMSQGRKTNDVVQKLAGGGLVVHEGTRPRAFSLKWRLLRETQWDDLDEIYAAVGASPLAMLVLEGPANDMKWCGFFHMTGEPDAAHDYPYHSNATVTIQEA